MFWIALSMLIMNLTGQGDDTHAFRMILERARDAVEDEVKDAVRRKAAEKAIDEASDSFVKHRERFQKITDCIEKADARYDAKHADYDRCLSDVGPAWDAGSRELIEFDRAFRSALTPSELIAVRRAAEK
jgi:hypothetical protein